MSAKIPSPEKVRLLFPNMVLPHFGAFIELGEALFSEFGIADTENRLHFFLAQLGHESAGLVRLEENLNYRAERLLQVWPSRFPDIDSARPFAHRPADLANHVYGGRMGNEPESGDGWTYRGRGYIQLTGRGAYKDVGKLIDVPLEASPELAIEPAFVLRAACGFWKWKDLNAICDTGNFVSVTKRINGGTNGLEDRRQWLNKVRRTLLEVPIDNKHPLDTIIGVQKALQLAGFTEVGAADGILGTKTIAAIAAYRLKYQLPPGDIDDALLKELDVED